MRNKQFLILLLFVFSINSFSQSKDTAKTEMQKHIDESTFPRYIIIAGASSDFKALDYSAKDISKKTGIVYSNNEMVYDKELGMIVPKDTVKYDIDAGQDMPRRYEENLISIEMMHHYSKYDPKEDRSKMIIITGIFPNKEDAQKQLKLIQKAVPTAYIKKIMLYMGCTH